MIFDPSDLFKRPLRNLSIVREIVNPVGQWRQVDSTDF